MNLVHKLSHRPTYDFMQMPNVVTSIAKERLACEGTL